MFYKCPLEYGMFEEMACLKVPRGSRPPWLCHTGESSLYPASSPRCSVLQRSGVGGDLVLVFGQLHLVRGEGPAAVRIAVHFDDGALEAEVIGHLQADREPILRDKHTLW